MCVYIYGIYTYIWSQPPREGLGPSRSTHRAIACRRAAGCLEWNMSQSGCSSADRNTCAVCEKRGFKMSWV